MENNSVLCDMYVEHRTMMGESAVVPTLVNPLHVVTLSIQKDMNRLIIQFPSGRFTWIRPLDPDMSLEDFAELFRKSWWDDMEDDWEDDDDEPDSPPPYPPPTPLAYTDPPQSDCIIEYRHHVGEHSGRPVEFVGYNVN